jgi:hypothetical protein
MALFLFVAASAGVAIKAAALKAIGRSLLVIFMFMLRLA